MRQIELAGYVDIVDAGLFVARIDTWKKALDPTAAEPVLILDSLEDGTQRYCWAVPTSFLWTHLVPQKARISVELDALDPFWYGVYGNSTMDSGLIMDNGEVMDSSGEITVTPTSTSYSITLDPASTAEVERIRIRFVGPSLSAPGIEVDTPDGLVGFVMTAALATGEELTVDARARTVTIAGVTQRAAMTLKAANRHGEYVRFRPGTNTVRVLGMPATARILFSPTFL